MTSTSATTNSVFQAFIEAQHALEQLPAVEQELASTKAELDTTHHALDDAELRAMQLEDDLNDLRATLAAKEEALAAATFREQAAADKLRVLRSVLGGDEPVVGYSDPVTVDHGEAASTNEQGQGDTDPTTSTTHASSSQGSFSGGTGNGSSGESSSHGDTHVAAPAASTNEQHPEITHTEDYFNMGEARSAASTGATYGGVSSSNAESPGDVSTGGQREMDPTAQFQNGVVHQSPDAQSTLVGSVKNASGDNDSNPAPYWQKPATTSWKDWVAAGNQPAPWLGKDFFDPHTVAAK